MIIASIILGILLIASGIFCIMAPVETFMSAAYFLAILLFIYGIFGIIRFFRKRALVIEFVMSVIAVVIGFIYVFRPGNTPAVGTPIGIDRFVLFVIAAWFLIKGCVTVGVSVRTRDVNRQWFWGVIAGVLSIIVGVYCFIQPVFAAAATGTLIGICFVQCGIDLIAFGLTVGVVKGAAIDLQRDIAAAAVEAGMAAEQIRAENEKAAAEAAAAAETAEKAADAVDAAVEETVETVEETVEAAAEAVEEKAEEAAAAVEEKAEEAAAAVEEKAEEAVAAVEEAVDAASDAVEDQTEKTEE